LLSSLYPILMRSYEQTDGPKASHPVQGDKIHFERKL
jgi:hypothetical protein